MEDIVIVSAARTPVGNFNGAFATLPAHDLGKVAVQAAIERAGLQPGEVDEVILGQILAAGEGQNPARQAARAAGVPDEKTAFGINQLCGSGLRAVALAAQQVRTGESRVVVAGGQESMTQAPHAAHLRAGTKMGELGLMDTMLKDGLWDAFHGYHMGTTAENVARQYQITRQQQDEFAVGSQQKASAAQKAGRFKDEIAPVTVKGRKGDTVVSEDEYIRHDANLESMAKLRPAFSKDGTVTAGNASGINDAAAALVVMSAAEAERRGDTTTALVRVEQYYPVPRPELGAVLERYPDAEVVWAQDEPLNQGAAPFVQLEMLRGRFADGRTVKVVSRPSSASPAAGSAKRHQAEQADLIPADDAVLAISFTPYAPVTLDLASRAARRGVPVVAITDTVFSPLAQVATIWLEVAEADHAAFRLLAGTFALAMTLAIAVAERRQETGTAVPT